MKKILFVVTVIVLFSMRATAAGPLSFGLQATGANLNVTGLTDVYGFGFGGGVHLDVNLPLLFSFRVQGDYVSFSSDGAKYAALIFQNPAGISIDGGRVSILAANVNTKLSPLPLPIVSPYLTAGIGLAKMDVSAITFTGYTGPALLIPGLQSSTSFSGNLGAGVDLDLIAVKLYLEARYTWIFTSGSTSTYVPVSLGVTF